MAGMERMDSCQEDEIAGQFFAACASGNIATVKDLLTHSNYALSMVKATCSEDPMGKKVVEKTLYTAAMKSHYDIVKVLLKVGMNPNVHTGLGTPIYAAAKGGSLDVVRLLVEKGAEFKGIRGGFSPLFVACLEGQLGILKYLVKVGANLYAFDNPPLVFTACSAGKLPVVKYLMEEMEFDIHRTINGGDALQTDGRDTLLYTACARNKLDIASYLVGEGALITQTISSRFPQIIKDIVHRRFRPIGTADPPQFYQARLKELGLSEMPWKFLADYSRTLSRLELRSNFLTSLPDKIFQMPSLKNLDISHNRLPEICQEVVPWKCTSLLYLDASHNQLTYIPSGLFTMAEVSHIDVSYNLLSRLPGDPEDPSALSSEGLPNEVVWCCEKLKKLDISHNRVRALPDTFSEMRRLNVMNGSHNYLKELPQSFSWGCINLTHLDVSNNQLTDLPIGSSVYWMHSLERLYLGHNRFTEISRNITELTHLTVLNLTHNMIRYLPPTAHWTCNRLNKLDLSHNKIDRLSHKSEEEQSTAAREALATPPEPRHSSAVRSMLANVLTSRPRPERRQRHQPDSVPLMEAGPDDDEARELPADLWNNCLQSLYLQSNRIKLLPDYIGMLSSLARLDISHNPDIRLLPLRLGRLRNCWELTMHGLKPNNIPQHLLPGVRGVSTKHLLAYLRAQLRNCVPYNHMKLMVVGLQGRGKTTLLSVLRNPGAALPGNVSTVGVNVTEWVVHAPSHAQPRGRRSAAVTSARQNMDVLFSTWDLAGQEVYYATHQCFLSRNTLYLVVWSMEEGEKGIHYLTPWLLNIQARAPHSPVLIVGTHLDRLPSGSVKELKAKYLRMIEDMFKKPPGFPKINGILFVSCTIQEGIRELTETIHHVALNNAVDRDTGEKVIGMQVPASYSALQQLVLEEVQRCQEKEIPPVLNQKEFATLAESIPDGDILDPEELSLAAQFLHDNGVLLHYNDHLRGLNNLYFIDPVWLADLLAEVVTVPQKQAFVHNGLLKESNVAFIFRDSRRFPSNFLPQYLQLLERFEIALDLGNGQRLIPSMLPTQRPVMSFVDPEPIAKQPMESEEVLKTRREVLSSSNCSDTVTPRTVSGMEVIDSPVSCIRRRYKMAYIPSGFWSRLISRLIINLKRSGLMESHAMIGGVPPIIYWRRGIVVMHSVGRFLVESIQSTSSDMSGVGVGDAVLEASAKFVGEGVDQPTSGPQGVDITVWSSEGDFSAMGYVVDQLDSLIDEWFPGLNDVDVEGDWLIQRQVLWKVPPEITLREKDSSFDRTFVVKDSWSIGAEDPSERGEIYVFSLEHCAAEALVGDTILCSAHKVHVPLSNLVPDVLLTDLPSTLRVNPAQLEFNSQDASTRLGRGGAGAVYKGRYRREVVAVKEFLTASQAEHSGFTEREQPEAVSGFDPDDDVISSGEALFLFRDLRQEVTVLAQLSHPNIVALLGVSTRPMCMVIEYAPMGSLFGILDKRVEQVRGEQALRASAILRMPGGVLGHEISTRIALQVALALRYLHKHGIVYRDLKSDNVLIWSTDVADPVNAKLADYGISRFANPGGVKGEEGTPGYLAPEAIRRRGEDQAFNEKVDIFSFAMLLFELLTGQRPFESLSTTQELNTAVTNGDRPCIVEANWEPSFPAMIDLMYDSWHQSSAERPSADDVVQRLLEPGFLCRKHCLIKSKDSPLQKIDTIYARPSLEEEGGRKSYTLWTWARQDSERNFSIVDVRKGVFNLPEKQAPGGRVYAMAATGEVEKRIWIGTADCEIQVFGYRSVGDPQCLWTFNMRDSVLALDTEVEEGRVKRVFASLANGTLCVFSRKSMTDENIKGDAEYIPSACTIRCDEDQFRDEAEDWSNPLILKLVESSKSAKCMVFVGKNQLWCGCGNTITVIDSIHLQVLKHIPVFVRRMALVNELVSNGLKVWGVGRQLSCVMEWDVTTFALVHVFNCDNMDPTDTNIISDPKVFEDLIDPADGGSRPHTVSNVDDRPRTTSLEDEASFNVTNDPINPSVSTNTPYSQSATRRTLRVLKPRPRTTNITRDAKASPGLNRAQAHRTPRKTISMVRNRVLRRQQGSTRTTSLIIVGSSLWVARGMGDVLIIDIQEGETHGQVLARLATESSEKYGNRSNHRLVCVAGEYVVSSQWLEPVDIRRADAEGGALMRSLAQPTLYAHQAITIWEAWNRKRISEFFERRASILELEEASDSVV